MSPLPVLLFLIPFTAALLAIPLAILGRQAVRALTLLALAGTTGTAALAARAILRSRETLHTYMGGWPPPIGIEWMLDGFSAFVALVIASVALVVVAGCARSVRAELRRREVFFYSLVLLLVSGLMGMIATHDLFNLFVHLEVASLTAYALVAAGGLGAPRAAFRYLTIGSLGASLSLLGVGFLYAATGSLNMTDVAARLGAADPRLPRTAGILIIAGLGVKMGLFPFHIWMPAAYTRAPAAASALMAPLVTKVSAYTLIRILFSVYQADYLSVHPALLDALVWAGAAAAVLGALLALLQSDLWTLLAYSSISQMGIVAMGAGLANASGWTGAVLHIANDALMKSALFLAAGAVLYRFGVRRVDELSALRGRAPWTMGAIAVAGFSLVGLPPLCGFFGKWYVLVGAVETEAWGLAAAVILGSLITAAYVFRILERLFFAPSPALAETPRSALGMVAASLVSAAGIVIFGLSTERVVTWMLHPALPAGLY